MIPLLQRGNLRVKPHTIFTPRPQSKWVSGSIGSLGLYLYARGHHTAWVEQGSSLQKQSSQFSIFITIITFWNRCTQNQDFGQQELSGPSAAEIQPINKEERKES